MTKTLFSRLRGHLDEKYPGGRYMAMVLAEVFQDAPRFAVQVFGLDGKRQYSVATEYRYSKESPRRADLVLLETGSEQVVALMEIKYEDEKTSGVYKQTLDYTRWAQRKKVPFLLLTKDPPVPKVRKLLHTRCQHISYAALYRKAEGFLTAAKSSKASYAAMRMFTDFLREETPVFDQTKLDDKILQLLLVRGLDLPHNTGLGKLLARDNMKEAIAALDRIVENMGVIADRFHDQYRTKLGNRPTVSFTFEPYVDCYDMFRQIKKKQTKMVDRR